MNLRISEIAHLRTHAHYNFSASYYPPSNLVQHVSNTQYICLPDIIKCIGKVRIKYISNKKIPHKIVCQSAREAIRFHIASIFSLLSIRINKSSVGILFTGVLETLNHINCRKRHKISKQIRSWRCSFCQFRKTSIIYKEGREVTKPPHFSLELSEM